RPENVVLLPPGADTGGGQRFSGRIVRRRFHGGQSVYTVAVLNTELDVVELGTAPRFADGAAVVAEVAPDLCWAFSGSGVDGAAMEYV
ncbi:MAG: TOBE domain-containing protein, partial [Rhodoblastus sp.]|nr:TOBE domain-containing protein [Rhodoblastus sp.]